ncbi:MAG: tripartite tricarboxylate transporter TctB family protein [Deltaproteobacteria bacterium]|nr:tripartite tricarboxylate transporter TctB family protein [Deltaproteobacteria bacterium]
MRIANQRDFAAGCLFVGIGATALLLGSRYKVGTAQQMGPGYFPLVLSGLLILLGTCIAVRSLARGDLPLPRFDLRPVGVIAAATVFFAVAVDRAGLALTTALCAAASRSARKGHGLRETAVLAVLLGALAVGLFGYGLGLQIPLWPRLG